jgi:tetratricopeptide (TPR) repeat protein
MAVGSGRKLVAFAFAAFAFGSACVAHADDLVSFGNSGAHAARQHLTPKAERLMAERRWSEAAVLLHRITDDEGTDSKAEVERAHLHLAVALRQLGYPSAGFAVASVIVSQPQHTMRDAALSELAKLVAELPEASEAAERLTLYSPKAIAKRLDIHATRPLYWLVNYRMGRYLYRAGRFSDAVQRLGYVDSKSSEYAAAQYLIAMCLVQQRKSADAIRSLERAERALAGSGRERAALTDLTRLGLGRIHYTDAFRPLARGKLAVDAKSLDLAIRYFGHVDVEGPHAPTALMEQAWAWFVLGRGERALGNLRTLQAPRFAQAFALEADVLRAAVHWEHCDTAGAAYVLATFRNRALAALQASERVLRSYSGEHRAEPFLRFAREVRNNRSGLGAEAGQIARSALATREIDGHIAYVDFVSGQRTRFRGTRPAFRASALGQRIEDSLKLAHDLAVHGAGSAALASYADSVSELRNSVRRAGRLLERSEFTRVAARPPVSKVVSVVEYDDKEHMLWPFDGEYWRDEFGSYRERVTVSCGADRVKWALR